MPNEPIIIVTGSGGRIGDAVMRRFGSYPVDVVGTEQRAPEPPPGCVYVPVDITSDDSIRRGLIALGEHHSKHVASVIHLAAYYDFAGRPSAMYEEVTVQGQAWRASGKWRWPTVTLP